MKKVFPGTIVVMIVVVMVVITSMIFNVSYVSCDNGEIIDNHLYCSNINKQIVIDSENELLFGKFLKINSNKNSVYAAMHAEELDMDIKENNVNYKKEEL